MFNKIVRVGAVSKPHVYYGTRPVCTRAHCLVYIAYSYCSVAYSFSTQRCSLAATVALPTCCNIVCMYLSTCICSHVHGNAYSVAEAFAISTTKASTCYSFWLLTVHTLMKTWNWSYYAKNSRQNALWITSMPPPTVMICAFQNITQSCFLLLGDECIIVSK